MSSRIDRYRPEELIGSAGVVDTFRVRLQETNALAVLKVLFPERVDGTAPRLIAERFLTAGRHALAGQAAGCVGILEVSDSPETAFIATEFVPGLDLAELVHRAGGAGHVEPALAGLVCAEVADALAKAHERKPPLLHLGLAPGNVRVTSQGQVIVLDFGFAAALRTTKGCRQEKWDFVAPELVGIDATTLSVEAARAADAYSLGLLLCHLLGSRGGKVALPGMTGISRQLLSAMRALTASEPTKRPDSLRAMVEPLAGGRASADERRGRLAEGLRRLGKGLGGSDGKPIPVSSVAGSEKSARVSPLAPPAPPRRSAAGSRPGFASRPRWRRVAMTVFLGGTVLGLGLLAWRLSGARTRIGRASPAEAAKVSVAKDFANATASVAVAKTNVEIQTRPKKEGSGIVGEEGVPAGQGYLPDPDQPTPSRVPNHLFLDTHPSQADVWVDGVLRGRTPIDLVAGPGGHRVVVIKPGYQMLRAVYDTTQGEYARRELERMGPPRLGNAFIDVKCATPNRYPVLIDDEETGHLCPASRLPVVSGKHTVGIFIPTRKTQVAVEVNVPPGITPTSVSLKE